MGDEAGTPTDYREPGIPVTVLMAVHNGSRYIRTAIESILAQAFRRFRLLIVDDASTDETREIIHSYDDARIEMLCLPRNVGQTAALNLGLRRASSPWIARMDADDYSAPARLEEQMHRLEQDPSLRCVGTFAWVFRDDPHVHEGVIEKPVDDATIKRQLLRGVPMIHGSLVLSRDVLLEIGGYDERYRYSADLDLYIRLLSRARAANLPTPLLGIRRHPGQGTWSRAMADENIAIFSRLLAATERSHQEHTVLRGSLSVSYLMRARAWQGERRGAESLKDLACAVRVSPGAAIKSLVSGLIPDGMRRRITRSMFKES